jgi:hypothetical protein
MDEDELPAPDSGIMQRLTNGFKAVAGGLVSSALWTAGLFGVSYGLGKWTKNEKYDFFNVAKAAESGHAVEELAKLAALPMGIGAAVNGGIGFFNGGEPALQANLPKIAGNSLQADKLVPR